MKVAVVASVALVVGMVAWERMRGAAFAWLAWVFTRIQY